MKLSYTEDMARPPVLTTARLTLRPFSAEDAAPIIASLDDWAITRWLTHVPFPYSEADATWWLSTGIVADGAVNWAIDDGTGLVGGVSVKPALGYWLATDRHGRGYMTEAATAVVDWHFDHRGASPLTSNHLIGNERSRAVLSKLGFSDTHAGEVTRRGDGRTVRIQRMRLTRERWMARRG